MDLLDPKNDYVFKRLFADSPDLLAELISAVRHNEPPVEVLQVLGKQPTCRLRCQPLEGDDVRQRSGGQLGDVGAELIGLRRPVSADPLACNV